MINADAEVERLRWFLNSRDFTQNHIDEVCDLAADEIGDMILEIVDNAVSECIEYAADLGCEQFIEELEVIETGNSYRIMAISGKTDFSVPDFPMKEALLNGPKAKISKEGKRYNIIPVGAPSNRPKSFTSSFQAQRSRDELISSARDAMNPDSNGREHSASTRSMVDNYRSRLASSIQQRKAFYSQRRDDIKESMKKEPDFRVVSDDSPDDSWVNPRREMDMTGFLMDINSRIEENMNHGISTLINGYTQAYGGL